MSQIQSAALTLAGVTLAFLLLVFLVSRWRRNAATPGQPKRAGTSRLPREISLPRRNRAMEAPIEISAARLARIRGKTPLAVPAEAAPETVADLLVAEPPAPSAAREVEQMLETIVAQVEQEADRIEPGDTGAVVVRLVPQIPPRDTAHPTSWLGGRPRLDRGTAWPEIREIPAAFIAQISFADLPRDLWDGLGPRSGAFAVFTHPRDGDVAMIAVADPGEPIDPPRPQDDAEHWFTPRGALHFGDLKPFSQPGIPAWPVDLVAVRPGDADPRDAETADEPPGDRFYRTGYDIADPAFHPFDWDLMVALAEILAMRIERFWRDVDSASPIAAQLAHVEHRLATLDAGGGDPMDRGELENMRASLGELVDATEAAAATNRDARARAEEIIAIIRDSARKAAFSRSDAAAVMEAIRAIRWTKVHRGPDPEGRPGAERIESQTLALTQHHPDAPLWVHDYHNVWFDRARRTYAADPDALSDAARAVVEPWCRELAARDVGSIGNPPDAHFETHATLIDLPSSALMGWAFGDADRLALVLRKADLAMGRFDRPLAQFGT